jgi:carbon-monoxide dehydrogenase iron sulfur subunit
MSNNPSPEKEKLHLSTRAVTRRDFIADALRIGGMTVALGNIGIFTLFAEKTSARIDYSVILVDYQKCTGCRTCETVCSAFNHPVTIDGQQLPGLGNPFYSNIRVHSYNPDVDVPNVCAMCRDNPCIEACPVEPDPKTGRRALYRDENTLAIKNDLERCIACGSCARACREQRLGVIIPNPETNKPERMCTLCDGDPQCVKHCPYGALIHVRGTLEGEFYGLPPDDVAARLQKKWYGGA